ncbi:MAG: PQQ-dependent sugar dehydrogenase [DPANN group archaeon]|nr:PQQ-dependent sugar dehydrogenase [DPANN group archaeon]
MNKTISVLALLLLALVFLVLPKPVQEKGFETQVVLESLDTVWSIDFLPDDTMIFTERPGRVNLYDMREKKIIATIQIKETAESGLHGVAVDPEHSENRHIYLYYGYDDNRGVTNRVSRYTLNNNELLDETILVDGIPGAQIHDGGRLKFGPDGKLYVTTGDAGIPDLAQDTNSVAGKVLRMNKDGSVPEDNPFGNLVWSYGHRNPQGIAFHPTTGILFESEHGPSMHDEVNIIQPGRNYGWPTTCGNELPGHEKPIACYPDFTIAPGSIAIFDKFIFIPGLRGNQLRKLALADDYKTVISEEALFTDIGRVREATVHDGYLYIGTSNRDGRGLPQLNDDKIIRIRIID